VTIKISNLFFRIKKIAGFLLPVILLLNMLSGETSHYVQPTNQNEIAITSLPPADCATTALRNFQPEKTQSPNWTGNAPNHSPSKVKVTRISQLAKTDFSPLISFRTFLTAYLYTDP
jgi:hypothetical protein